MKLTISDRVAMYELIYAAFRDPDDHEHRTALCETAQNITIAADTGEVPLTKSPTGAPVPSPLAPRSAASHVNANQPGFIEPSADLIGPAL